jgi:flagellar motor protein MotB
MRYSVSKQDAKRGDRLFFIIQPVSLLPLYNASFSWHRGSTLKAEAQTILQRNIQRLKENPKAQIHIAGYTPASGTAAYNQKLSERRAR